MRSLFYPQSVVIVGISETLGNLRPKRDTAGGDRNGFRGRPPADVESLKQLLVAFSQTLLTSPEIEDLEINPLIVLDAGAGCVVVDARMHVQQKEK